MSRNGFISTFKARMYASLCCTVAFVPFVGAADATAPAAAPAAAPATAPATAPAAAPAAKPAPPPALPPLPKLPEPAELMRMRTNRAAAAKNFRPVPQTLPAAQAVPGPTPGAQTLNPPVPFQSTTTGPHPPYAPAQRPGNIIPTPVQPLLPPNSLAWSSEQLEYIAKVGDSNAPFAFYLTNVASQDVLVNSVRTSCGCTVAKLPEQPWRLKPGQSGPINVSLDLRGKRGKITKTVTVDTTAGIKSLLVSATIPVDPAMEQQMNRSQNMQIALADRQVVFRGDCARCHVEPARGKTGEQLYTAACGICHEAEHRASSVPDLKALRHPTDHAYWTHWIKEGKAGTMMPAFSPENGGPLTHEQIASLAEWLSKDKRYQGTTITPADVKKAE